MRKNNSIELDKMTLSEFLDYLTDINWHTERVLVETIINGRDDLINRACKVRLNHSKVGYLTGENHMERLVIVEELNKEGE